MVERFKEISISFCIAFFICLSVCFLWLIAPAPALAGTIVTQKAVVDRVSCFVVGQNQYYSSDTACFVQFTDQGKAEKTRDIFERAAYFPVLSVLKEGDTVLVSTEINNGAFPSVNVKKISRVAQ
ncbi:MAG: hypothetical protein Q8T09_00255 [Candidatus Melainabacteria bacterium]|nr:hypothetical protein [Candidatus Melainabacteria bacterium]